MNESIEKANQQVLQMMSNYLNNAPDFIHADVVEDICQSCGVSKEYAFSTLLAAACGLDVEENRWDEFLFHQYFLPMVHQLRLQEYLQNPYYKHIKIPNKKIGNCELKNTYYKPYEAFVSNDLVRLKDGRVLPQIGFFSHNFTYPAVLEKELIWMTITPNEIETMKRPIEKAHGNVVTFGLGLGYYAYMVSKKSNVSKITVVDSNKDVISLFLHYILPQIPERDKITIIQGDAFEYAEKHLSKEHFDSAFTDLWHDVSDGIILYEKMKQLEYLSATTEYDYWIEESILCYK